MENFWFKPRQLVNNLTSCLQNGSFSQEARDAAFALQKQLLNINASDGKDQAAEKKLREAVGKTDGPLLFREGSLVQNVDQTFVDESLILSNLFQCNELLAAELLTGAETQTASFPGWSRGICAVLLYFEAKRSLSQALYHLIQNAYDQSSADSDCYTLISLLVEQGLIENLVRGLSTLSLHNLTNAIDAQRGFGSAKHRKMVTEIITETLCYQANCVLYLSECQHTAEKCFTEIVQALQTVPGVSAVDHSLAQRDLQHYEVTLLNCALDIGPCGLLLSLVQSLLSVRNYTEERETVLYPQINPMLLDAGGIGSQIHSKLCGPAATKFANPAFRAVAQLSWAVTIRMMLENLGVFGEQLLEHCSDDEEDILDRGLDNGALLALRNCIIACPLLSFSELAARATHDLIACTIAYFPVKLVKQLRQIAENECLDWEQVEQAGQTAQHSEPPVHFEKLLLTMSDLYTLTLKHFPNAGFQQQYFEASLATRSDTYVIQEGIDQEPDHIQTQLYKFLRECTNLSSPRLYCACLAMFHSLCVSPSATQECFELLKATGFHAGARMSWDRLFEALHQYEQLYTQRKLPAAVLGQQQVAQHQQTDVLPISHSECDCIVAWLTLIERVAERDEFSRSLIVSNVRWSAPSTFFSLIACPIVPAVKSALLTALTSLVHGDAVLAFHQALLSTGAFAGSNEVGGIGIRRELYEIEAKQESYNITISFLKLLCALSSAGENNHALSIYLEYVISDVLYKIKSRSYKDHRQVWEIARWALLLLTLLVEDLANQSSTTLLYENIVDDEQVRHPGILIMLALIGDETLFPTLMWLLQQASAVLDLYADETEPEQAALSTLRLLDACASLHDRFRVAMQDQQQQHLLTTPLDTLLLALNPTTSKTDHVCTIARFLTYTNLPQHALHATRILRFICRAPLAIPKATRQLTADPEFQLLVQSGFTDALDSNTLVCNSEMLLKSVAELEVPELRGLVALEIVGLLTDCVAASAKPNLGHLLLGYDLRRPDSTQLGGPSTSQNRTCLDAVIALLAAHKMAINQSNSVPYRSILVPQCYKLLSLMASSEMLAKPVLRFLRSCHYFTYEHLELLPLGSACVDALNVISQSEEEASILSLLSHEIDFLARGGQLTSLKEIVNLLICGMNVQTTSEDSSATANKSLLMSTVAASTSAFRRGSSKRRQRRILAIVSSLHVPQEDVEMPSLNFLDKNRTLEVMRAAVPAATGPGSTLQIDIEQLRSLLYQEVDEATRETALASRRAEVEVEVEDVLEYALRYNALRRSVAASCAVWRAWTQLVQTLLLASDGAPLQHLDASERCSLVLDLCLGAIARCGSSQSNLVAPMLLTSTHYVRSLLASNESSTAAAASLHVSNYVSLLDASLGSATTSPGMGAARLLGCEEPIAQVTRSLLDFLLRPGEHRIPMTNGYLYGALLNVWAFGMPHECPTGDAQKLVHAIIQSPSSKLSVRHVTDKLDRLTDRLCADAVNSSEQVRVLAFSCLTVLVATYSQHQRPILTNHSGYLRQIIDEIPVTDIALRAVLQSAEASDVPVYIYTARLSLFIRMAQCAATAQQLLQYDVLSKLSQCESLHLIPSSLFTDTLTEHSEGTVLAQRFFEVFSPALRLCLAVLNCSTQRSELQCMQVLNFVVSQNHAIATIMKAGSRPQNEMHLRLMDLCTSVLSNAAAHPFIASCSLVAADLYRDAREASEHCVRNVLSLLPSVSLFRDCILKPLLKNLPAGDANDPTTIDMECRTLSILSNVLNCCARRCGMFEENSSLHALFLPSLCHTAASGRDALPTLAALVTTSQSLSNFVRQLGASIRDVQHRLAKQNEPLSVVDMGEAQTRKTTLEGVSTVLAKQAAQCTYCLELCLYLLWRHLDHYLVQASSLSLHVGGPTLYQLTHKDSPMKTTGAALAKKHSGADSLIALEDPQIREALGALRDQLPQELSQMWFQHMGRALQTLQQQNCEVNFIEALLRNLRRAVHLNTQSGL